MKRSFHPGDEWLYFRLYGGPDSTDSLVEILPSLILKLVEKRLIRKWFYIRYFDPMNHLRLRFEIINPDVMGEIIILVKEAINDFVEEGMVWKTEIGTYEREIERYGEDWMETAEDIFYIDSQFWISILPQLREDEDAENKRWQAALLSADNILASFNQIPQNRIELMDKMVDSLSKEMEGGKKLRLQIDEKFRRNRESLERLISDVGAINLPGFEEALQTRHDAIESLVANHNSIPTWDTKLRHQRLSDLIHMSLNRCLRSKHRMHELVIYSFLRQLYVSEEAQKTKHRQNV